MPYDPSLDPAIKQLLDQQAEIQAKLAALLPQKYGPNIKVELDMLRHKHRALRAYAEDNCEMPCQLPFPAIVTCHRIVLSTVPYLFPRSSSSSLSMAAPRSRDVTPDVVRGKPSASPWFGMCSNSQYFRSVEQSPATVGN